MPEIGKTKPSIRLDVTTEQLKNVKMGDVVEVRLQGEVDSMSAGKAFEGDEPSIQLVDRKISSIKKAEKSLEDMEAELPKAER